MSVTGTTSNLLSKHHDELRKVVQFTMNDDVALMDGLRPIFVEVINEAHLAGWEDASEAWATCMAHLKMEQTS